MKYISGMKFEKHFFIEGQGIDQTQYSYQVMPLLMRSQEITDEQQKKSY
jgi:hypothetical protein